MNNFYDTLIRPKLSSKKQEQEKKEDNIRKKIKDLFDTENGQAILEFLKNKYHCNKAIVCEDSNRQYYVEGQRSVLFFLDKITKGENDG